MATRTVTKRDELLAQLRAQRQLPAATERRRIREAAGVSIRQLAEALGVSPMAPVRWEQGAMPRDPRLVREYGELLVELSRLAPLETRAPALAGTRGARGRGPRRRDQSTA
jgi:transcriptional regulator with XRE-family HTH domain